MIDRTQLREALEKTGIAEFMVQEETLPAHVIVIRAAAALLADPDTLIISKVDAEHWHRSAVAILEPFMRDEHLADRLVRASYALDALLEGQPK